MKRKKDSEEVKQEPKKKEQKIVYIDDGSTVADMSGTYQKGTWQNKSKSTAKDKAKTFFGTMKKMLLPMLVTLTALTLFYIFFLAVTGNLF